MASRRGYCTDCKARLPADDPRLGGRCGPCKELGVVMLALHHRGRPPCEADRAGAELRVELYRAVVARGGALFETPEATQ